MDLQHTTIEECILGPLKVLNFFSVTTFLCEGTRCYYYFFGKVSFQNPIGMHSNPVKTLWWSFSTDEEVLCCVYEQSIFVCQNTIPLLQELEGRQQKILDADYSKVDIEPIISSQSKKH